jgi:hypothetical protein
LDYEESWRDPPENLGPNTTATIVSFAGAGPADAEAASEMGMPHAVGSAQLKFDYISKI